MTDEGWSDLSATLSLDGTYPVYVRVFAEMAARDHEQNMYAEQAQEAKPLLFGQQIMLAHVYTGQYVCASTAKTAMLVSAQNCSVFSQRSYWVSDFSDIEQDTESI